MRYSSRTREYFDRPVLPCDGKLRGEAGSVAQGALIVVAVDVEDGKLSNLGFRAYACPHIIAAAHRATELLAG